MGIGHAPLPGSKSERAIKNTEMISVVVPVFNRQEKAERAVLSVLEQKGLGPNSLEVIVVDDGSTPPFTIRSNDDRVRVLRRCRNAGPAAARSAGIKAARGDFIAFLDSDDVWLPDKLARQLEFFDTLASEHDRSRLIISCGFYYPHRIFQRLEARIPREAHTLDVFAAGCWFSPGSTQFAHRSVYQRIGLPDESLRRLEDYEWTLRFARLGGSLRVCSCVGVIVAPSYASNPRHICESTDKIAEKFGPEGKESVAPDDYARVLAYLELEKGAVALQIGRPMAALWHFGWSFRFKPRMHAPLLPFWYRSNEVPKDVEKTYRKLLTPRAGK